jgi:hypothetical protein
VALTELKNMDGKLTKELVSNFWKTKGFNVEKKKVRGFSGFSQELRDLFYIYPIN